jgi:hypothetical protein
VGTGSSTSLGAGTSGTRAGVGAGGSTGAGVNIGTAPSK